LDPFLQINRATILFPSYHFGYIGIEIAIGIVSPDYHVDFDMDGFPYMEILKQKMFEQLWLFQQYS